MSVRSCATGALPQQVILSVVSTDTVAKGDEKSPQYKPATVGAGRKVMVPPFIVTGKGCNAAWVAPKLMHTHCLLSCHRRANHR